MARGADVQARMEDGTTPSQLAMARGFTELGERLASMDTVVIDDE
jgi:hypothetical protein